jgi:hypothetical protein
MLILSLEASRLAMLYLSSARTILRAPLHLVKYRGHEIE